MRKKKFKELGMDLTLADQMTDKELDKYINQIAFSGAEEFVNKPIYFFLA